jgi:DNA-directed RNA polymerase subunit alpha
MPRIPLPVWERRETSVDEQLSMSTAEIGLAVRTVNCLEDHGVLTVEELLNCTREKLLSFPNFGEKTLEEVYLALEGIGFARRRRATGPAQSVCPSSPSRPMASRAIGS